MVGLGILGYAGVAAFCRPLTLPALVAVMLVGVPVAWYGMRRRPAVTAPVGTPSVAVWGGLGAVVVAVEVALLAGPNDLAWPTLSTLLDPVLATYPGRVVGYLLWLGAGVWLVRR
ncbi:hypothetical protein GCM10009557_62350 [Virgisporangium ochraceum]|uniref:Uncharacterized protein n=1 Tax=Virgisporangium ochraceum TaxID=65505 RepID=A0A8J3ZV01_9ACTN|nr:hypothetical protein [Virgisporangium ochraceum]GIJ70924.1 hypothetical protein Voc01_058410 [Virgisporangium ochraceum]